MVHHCSTTVHVGCRCIYRYLYINSNIKSYIHCLVEVMPLVERNAVVVGVTYRAVWGYNVEGVQTAAQQ